MVQTAKNSQGATLEALPGKDLTTPKDQNIVNQSEYYDDKMVKPKGTLNYFII